MKFKTKIVKGLRVSLLLYFGAFSLGCVSATSKNMVANFGGATKALAGQTEATVKQVSTSDSNFAVSSALSDNTLGVGSGLVIPSIPRDSIELRLRLLGEIAKYSDALLAMSSDDEAVRIDKASRDLYSALGALNTTIQKNSGDKKPPISDNDLQIIATVTDVAGRWFFERARLKALQTTINKANPAITQAIDLLKTDLDENGSWSKSLSISLTGEAKNLYKVAQSTSNLLERRNMLAESQQLYDQSISVQGIFHRLTSAMEELKKAHSALAVALENDSSINVKEALSSLSKFEDEINRIYAFQASLASSNNKN